MAKQKALTLVDGKISEALISASGIGLCDVSLFMASMFDNYLTNGQDILFDQNGIPLGMSSGMMPQACKAEYNNGLMGIDERFLYGLEGEMLI